MNDMDKRAYEDFLAAIRDFLSHKMNMLDAEASSAQFSRNTDDRESCRDILKLCEAGEFLSRQSDELREECVTLNGMLADLVESIYQSILEERRVREHASSDDIAHLVFSLLAKFRKLLRRTNELAAAFESLPAAEGDYVVDDRLELVLVAMKKTTEFERVVVKEHTRNLVVYYGSFGLLCGLGVALILTTTLYALIPIFELLEHLQLASAPAILGYAYVFRNLSGILLVAVILCKLAIRIYLAVLAKETKEGNVSARFVSAFYYLTPIGFSIRIDIGRFVHEVFLCAESGYPPALYEVGKIYEFGCSKLVKSDKRLAMQYYAKASGYVPKAKDRYERLSRNF